jgi:signal transduction histidine kinase/CheY-like chemotaxis protein
MRQQAVQDEASPAPQAESPLHSGELHFRRLLEKLPAAAYTCDLDGLITYFNPQAVKLWGRAPKLNDPVDRFCGSFKLFAAADGSPITHDQCWMALTLRNNRAYNGHEILVERPDGQRLTVLAYANPIHDESGKLLGAVNVLVDISDRKQAEDENARLYARLQEHDRRKDEFLATLAHELRNPLAPIRNAVHILASEGPPDPALQWARDVIDRQVRQMARLVDDLLDLSRVSTGKLELRKAPIDLREVLHAAAETSRPVIEACGHEFIVHLPQEPVCLDADLTRLAQVVSNLLNNAAKYTERGGRVWLTAERQGSDAVVTVRDTGVGIHADMLPRVFDMFTQVERSLDRSRGGLGIGLTLVKRLVEMHGGSVTAHSDGPDRGSTFTVRLPVVLGAAPRADRDAEPPVAVSSLRLLVVDDNADAAASLAMLLRLMGNDVRTAHDGLEAVALAEEFRPDVALLDIGLPRLNGYEAAREIRRRPWGGTMVLIAATGWGQEADRQRSKEAGFDHHLVKPVDPAALTRLLASLEQAVRERRG